MAAQSLIRSGIVNYVRYKNTVSGNLLAVDYLVIAGGGGGGGSSSDGVAGGGGAGAGGYRTSICTSGSGLEPESRLILQPLTNYAVSIGAGGAGGGRSFTGAKGIDSVFANITSLGGGAGRDADDFNVAISTGGSGGGASGSSGGDLGTGTVGQGTNGGTRNDPNAGQFSGGGGGGSSSAGSGRSPGIGTASPITGVSVVRAAGGWGQGTGNFINNSAAGAANTGTGGSGGASGTSTGGAGGSGVVILRYPSSYTITIGAGLVGSTATVGVNRVTTITSGAGNVSWAR
jgi:hypothetical protein